jgi:hypothetical protein
MAPSAPSAYPAHGALSWPARAVAGDDVTARRLRFGAAVTAEPAHHARALGDSTMHTCTSAARVTLSPYARELGGGSVAALAAQTLANEVTLRGSMLCWTVQSGTVNKLDLRGGKPVTLSERSTKPAAIAVAATGGHVIAVAAAEGRPYAVAVDEHWVYWLERPAKAADTMDQEDHLGKIRKSPSEGRALRAARATWQVPGCVRSWAATASQARV